MRATTGSASGRRVADPLSKKPTSRRLRMRVSWLTRNPIIFFASCGASARSNLWRSSELGPESGRPAVEKTHLAKAQDEGVVADAQSYNFFRELWSERPFQSLA